MSTHRIETSVRFLENQEQTRDVFLAKVHEHEPTWQAEPIDGYTSNGINLRPEWLVVWSVPLDEPKQAEKVASSIGRRVRALVGDDAELVKAVGTAGIWYFVKTDREPARRS
jgi:hypothetical protein